MYFGKTANNKQNRERGKKVRMLTSAWRLDLRMILKKWKRVGEARMGSHGMSREGKSYDFSRYEKLSWMHSRKNILNYLITYKEEQNRTRIHLFYLLIN